MQTAVKVLIGLIVLGGLTAKTTILFTQALPALVALALVLLPGVSPARSPAS